MTDRDGERIERQFERVEAKLPDRAARFLRWLREPSSRWVRIPIGLLLILGGIFSFLPVLGLWMAPLGLLLLAQDVPPLRRPMGRAMTWGERKWVTWRRRMRGESEKPSP